MINFKIKYLDHIAIRVKDLAASALWYEEVLGLKKVQPKEWGAFPIMMLAGQSGIALFPVKNDKNRENLSNKSGLVAFHFAFNIDRSDFENLKTHLKKKNIEMKFQDSIFFQSIFIKDLDNYVVEITTQIKDF